MNSIQLIGRLTRDIEMKYTTRTQTAIIDNCIAVAKDREKTNFINLKVIGKQAENLERYCHKGSLIGVTGSLEVEEYEKDGQKRSYIYVLASKVDFLDKREELVSFKEVDEKLPF